MSNSINTNISAYYAQANITNASQAASASVSRLSSGNRIVQASDDVAALATGTSLQTQVSALKTAQANASQGSSLLQVADGALSQIQNILQQQKAIALQAASGSLTDTDRGFLNQEFQALSTEINSLTGSTTFNGVALLDGSLSQAAGVSNSTTQATAANASIGFSSNLVSGDALIINGVTLTAGTTFAIGATAADTAANLATKLNSLGATTNAATLGQASYSAQGATLSITSRTGGSLGNNFTIDATNVTNNKASVGGQYGGSTVKLLTSSAGAVFSSATTAIVANTAAANTPFQTGDALTVSIGSSSPTTLYTLRNGDSLTSIVNGINSNSNQTGISAVLVTDSGGYNIQLNLHNGSGNVSVNGGSHFFNGITQTHTLNGATSQVNLLSDTLALASNGGSLVAASTGAATVNTPFVAGNNIKVSVAGGTFTNLLDNTIPSNSLVAGDTATTIVTKINNSAAAGALGIHATVASNNVVLTYADPTQNHAIAIQGGTNFYNTDALGQTTNNGLAGAYSSFNLLGTGVIAPDTSLVTAGSVSAQTIFKTGQAVDLTLTNNVTSGTTLVHLLTNSDLAAGDSLQAIATKINANTTVSGAQANGIHASVVQDAGGKYNIQLSYANSVKATATVLNPISAALDLSVGGSGTTFYNYATEGAPSPTVTQNLGNTSQLASFRFFNTTFATNSLAPGQVVVGASASAATPFQNLNTLTVNLGASSDSNKLTGFQISSALATGDTLSDIVGKINTYGVTNTTGISATLDGNGTNILLHYTPNSTNHGTGGSALAVTNPPILSISGGANFYNNTDSLDVAASDNTTNGLNNAYTSIQLFATGFATAATAVSAGAATNAIPFVDGDNLRLTIPGYNGGAAFSIVTALSVGSTVASLVTQINTNATALSNGVHAQLITDGGGNSNILITIADKTNIGSAAASITLTDPTNTANFTNHPLTAAATTTYVANPAFQKASTITGATANGNVGVTTAGVFGLAGGSDNGLGLGNTTVTGTIGDSLVTGLSQNASKVTVSFPQIDPAALLSTSNFGNAGATSISVGGHSFTFVSAATAADQILIGSTLQQTLDNAVSTISNYGKNAATGDTAFQLNQIKIARDGNNLVISGKGISDVKAISGAAASTIAASGFTNGTTVSNSGSLANSSRSGTSTFGIDTTGVSNAAFSGSISGFAAAYTGTANTVNLSVKVGDYTYTANAVNTNPQIGGAGTDALGNETVRFFSNTVNGGNGGYFDVQLANNAGQSVNSASDAVNYSKRVNAAFSSLNLSQERQLSSYSGTQAITSGGLLIGSLIGSSVAAQLPSFGANKLTNISVLAPTASNPDAQISLTIDGNQYVTKVGLGSQLGANQTYRLTSTVNPNNFVDFTTGNTSISLSNTANAQAVQTALSGAFGVSNGAGALSFQVGASSKDTLAVSIGSANTSSLFSGQTLDVSTQSGAQAASSTLDNAINSITALRSGVGALESQFNFASAALQSSTQNQDAARGALLDTDIALESTQYATEQVKLQAGISVLAQANQSLQNLLKLIQ